MKRERKGRRDDEGMGEWRWRRNEDEAASGIPACFPFPSSCPFFHHLVTQTFLSLPSLLILFSAPEHTIDPTTTSSMMSSCCVQTKMIRGRRGVVAAVATETWKDSRSAAFEDEEDMSRRPSSHCPA